MMLPPLPMAKVGGGGGGGGLKPPSPPGSAAYETADVGYLMQKTKKE